MLFELNPISTLTSSSSSSSSTISNRRNSRLSQRWKKFYMESRRKNYLENDWMENIGFWTEVKTISSGKQRKFETANFSSFQFDLHETCCQLGLVRANPVPEWERSNVEISTKASEVRSGPSTIKLRLRYKTWDRKVLTKSTSKDLQMAIWMEEFYIVI